MLQSQVQHIRFAKSTEGMGSSSHRYKNHTSNKSDIMYCRTIRTAFIKTRRPCSSLPSLRLFNRSNSFLHGCHLYTSSISLNSLIKSPPPPLIHGPKNPASPSPLPSTHPSSPPLTQPAFISTAYDPTLRIGFPLTSYISVPSPVSLPTLCAIWW